MNFRGSGRCCFLLFCFCISSIFDIDGAFLEREIPTLQYGSVILECNDTSLIKNKWKHNNNFLFAGNNAITTNLHGMTLHKHNYSLQIENVSFAQEGLYLCIRNATIVRKFKVIVEVEPVLYIAVDGSYITSEVVFQEEISAQCYALGAKPPVNLTWVISNQLREYTNVECKYSKRKNNRTFDCMTSINMEISDQSGNLTCMTSDDQLFKRKITTVVFSINGSNNDLTKIHDSDTGRKKDRTDEPEPYNKNWAMAVVILPLSGVFGIGIFSYCRRRRKIPFELTPRDFSRNDCVTSDEINDPYHILSQDYVTVEPSNSNSVSHSDKISPTDMENVTLGEKLHSGSFFDHFVASITHKNSKIVAKSLTENSQLSDLYIFQDVASCFTSLFTHENVAEILGASTSKVPSYIYQEYIDGGSLREYLLKHYQQSRYSQIPSLVEEPNMGGKSNKFPDKVQFCFQIADGMSFLGRNKFCHPALSASKVLLSSTGNCKLYDFWPESLSKLRLGRLFVKEIPPVAWLAPETVFFRQYSTESDVWSFSIMVWEIYSAGDIPYRGLTNDEIETAMRKSCSLDRPPNCPGGVYNLMLSSWNLSMKDRPSFNQLREKFATFGGGMSKDTQTAQAFESFTKLPQYSVVQK